MIDSHCHLNHDCFSEDLEHVVQRAKQVGVTDFILAGVQSSQWVRQVQLKKEYSNMHYAIGIHPWFSDKHSDADLDKLKTLLPQAIAIGECGLDFSPNKPSHDIQMHFFQAQLTLAKRHQKPLIIHAVKASDIALKTVSSYQGLRGVVHGFSGSVQQANNWIDIGFYIGIGTRILHSNAKKVHALACQLPLNALLLETDSPDGLSKHERNEPANLIKVAQMLATIRHESLETVLSTCNKNTKELFNL